MRLLFVICLYILTCNYCKAQATKTRLYLIPGQGSDLRLFKNLQIDTSKYQILHIKYIRPIKHENMYEYAQRLAVQIDTIGGFCLMGVSLGGMIATEMTDFISPQKTIIISSAKCRSEIPTRYRFQKQVPIFSLLPKTLIKLGARVVQPIVEPDRKKENKTCAAMLKAKDPVFLKRTIYMIVNWDRTSYSDKITHIHGNADHTLPIKKIDFDYKIDKGSHMMVLTYPKAINQILSQIL